jgi:uracil-DNA glycosylase
MQKVESAPVIISRCSDNSACNLSLSSVEPGDERRGSRDPLVLIVTEAPDKESSEGSAYSGGLSNRIISMFCDEKYGIGLEHTEEDAFPEFLVNYRFYATSAIKCHLEGGTSEVANYVISQCRDRFLEKQIKALENLELIITMGNVAAASITRQSLTSISITSRIGNQGRGLFPDHSRYELPVVLLPHLSGNNPYSNPPVINSSGNPSYWGYKMRFRRALVFIRDILREMDYEVLTTSPSCWDRPPGLSEFS